MDKRYAIFDMDGTLVDSMPYWRGLPLEFLKSKGITDMPEDAAQKIRGMTLHESAHMFSELYDMPLTGEELNRDLQALMKHHYLHDIELKPGIRAYLDKLCDQGVVMCVVSATAHNLMEACLRRLDIFDYFAFIMSCETYNTSKREPGIFHLAATRLGATPAEIAVYEDAPHAVQTAKEAGYYLVGVYDTVQRDAWPAIREMADHVIHDFGKEAETL